MEQLSLFPKPPDPRPPETVTWNLWHGCTRAGTGCSRCFSSDFFHKDADEWRNDAWDMIRERSDCSFFMITKRPEL